jgi:hypothetical protein
MMRKVNITRDSDNGIVTIGHLQVLNDYGVPVFAAYTCELPYKDNQHNISCIPEGTYKAVWCEMLDHPGHYHYLLQNVPDRDGIFIHYMSNIPAMDRGCIALCENVNQSGITTNSSQTVDTFEELFLVDNVQQEIEIVITATP